MLSTHTRMWPEGRAFSMILGEVHLAGGLVGEGHGHIRTEWVPIYLLCLLSIPLGCAHEFCPLSCAH